jgi:1-acyl-sn-glycerol-3-phosphate acyltransferase
VVSNHQSFIDIPILFRALPINLYFVAKKEIKKMPFIGWFMMLTGMIFIDRSNRQKSYASMQLAGQKIKKGKNVLTFPEGTRSKDGIIGTFKKGSFSIAIENNIAILPVSIANAENVWNTNKMKLNPGMITVKIGEPILPNPTLDVQQFANSIQEKVSHMRGY